MSTDTVEEHRAASRVDQPTTSAAALTAMGIVYGDLGTSPLYTLQAVAQTFDGGLSPSAALGSLSLIFWLLIITVSIKYCLFVMRADNHGEGGILALTLLTRASWHGRGRALVIMGLFGAALIYGDGIITPAISVLSALEGLNQATEIFKPHVMPMAVVVLLALFAVQSRGTANIGKVSATSTSSRRLAKIATSPPIRNTTPNAIAVSSAIDFISAVSFPAVMSVCIRPGVIELTRTLLGPSSRAMALPRPRTPAFAAE